MNMRWMMMACLSLCASTACDLPDKNIGDETQGDETQGDSGEPGDDCEPGDQVPAADGCNTCYCEDDGTLSCTEIGCVDETDGDPGDTSGDCEPGSTVPAPDGCNTCECDADGTIGACTLIDCDPGECEPGSTVPAPDGCNTCECNDDGTIGACTEADCDPGDVDTDPFDGPEVSSCSPETPFDDLAIEGASIEGDTLTIDVAYSGCGPGHPLGACWDGMFAESSPVQVNFDVAHDNLGEACEAYPSDSVDIDLTPLRESYQELYAESGTISINIGGAESIDYSF
ncbi:MAG: hypothetical protein ACE37F_32010 [Nannocystaceae bacterium]|nr:hypothetical protein [bacterium]